MKRSPFSWLHAAGLMALGGAGAYGVSRYLNRPLGDKMKIGDVAFVPIGAVRMLDTAQQSAIDLSALGPAGNVAIEVTVANSQDIRGTQAIPSGQGIAGKDFGLRVPVTFARSAIARLERGGVAVT